jgi:hypothetical protein
MSLQDIFSYIKIIVIEIYYAISKALHWLWTANLLDIAINIFYIFLVSLLIFSVISLLIKGAKFFESLYNWLNKK